MFPDIDITVNIKYKIYTTQYAHALKFCFHHFENPMLANFTKDGHY